MIPLMFAAALVDTIIAQPMDYETVFVHEWGVVTFCQEQITLGAVPEHDLFEAEQDPAQWNEPVVRAPVVYFYGAPFSGSFTVDVPSGHFIETMPLPGSLLCIAPLSPMEFNRAVWNIAGTYTDCPEEMLGTASLETSVTPDLLEAWRLPPSHSIEFEGGSYEKFIYYECTISDSDPSILHPVLFTEEGPVLHYDYDGPVAVFWKTPEGMEMDLLNDESVPPGVMDDQSVHEFFLELMCTWAGDRMKPQEISVMWDTWEGWIIGGHWNGDTLLVFPLPEQSVERISTITLETQQNFSVEYTRFYLGMLTK